MTVRYRHTQHNVVTLVASLFAAVGFSAYDFVSETRHWFLWVFCLAIVVFALIFWSLSVEVGDREIEWRFGLGLWRYRIALADIERAEPVRTTWVGGYGVRMRPSYRLYNVGGLEAVALSLKSGKTIRIGTDDPQGLVAALKAGAQDAQEAQEV
jgi:hypothetical protein